MGSLFYILETGIVLVTMFTLLVAAHELGHYLFARMFNMGVEEFAIGFGKRPIFEWMKRTYEIPMRPGEVAEIDRTTTARFDIESSGSRAHEDMVEVDTPSGKILRETTRFTVRAWPLGGFVRIKGMMPEEDGSETTIAGGFYSKAPWQRLLVLFAGPLFSVLAGILILVPLIMIEGGKPNNRPVLGMLAPEGAAMKAGLHPGDRIVAINGTPIKTFFGVVQVVRESENKKLDFEIERSGQQLHISVTPELEKVASSVLSETLEPTKDHKRQAKLGAAPTLDPIGFGEAVLKAGSAPIKAVAGLADMVRHPATIKDNVGGPLSISTTTYETVKLGLPSIFELAALLSISIGILNLLPVAPLDGGQMTMAFAEMFRRGKRLSMQVQSLVNFCGLIFMGVLIISVFWIDINRIVDNNSQKDAPPKKAAK